MKILKLFAVPVFILVAGCSENSSIADGSGTEGGNVNVVGKVLINSGAASANTEVKLFPANHDDRMDDAPGNAWIDTTDSRGAYSFSVSDSVTTIFNVLAKSLDNGKNALLGGISVKSKAAVRADDAVLKTPGDIRLILPAKWLERDAYVYIPGTDISQPVSEGTNAVLLQNVPAGVIPEIYVSRESMGFMKYEAGENIQVQPAVTTEIRSIKAAYVVLTFEMCDGERVLFDRMQSMGIDIALFNDDSAMVEQMAGMDVIILSPSIQHGAFCTRYQYAPFPIVDFNTACFRDLGMTGGSIWMDWAAYFEDDTHQYAYEDSIHHTDLSIADAGHPVSGGLSGTLPFLTSPHYLVWGVPSPESEIIAVHPDRPEHSIVFLYESGSQMPGLVAAARRAGVSIHEDLLPLLNEDGWLLVENSIWWALGLE